MNLCILPARGGSKRISRKNIKPFAGKPMIAHAIGLALDSGLFQHIVVSTDDDEIAEIARAHGAEVPFTRPAALADDHAPTAPVIAHAVTECESYGWKIDSVCCLYPCVPLLQLGDLKAGLDLLNESQAPYSFAIAEFSSAIQRALKRNEDGRTSPFELKNQSLRTQDLPPAYYDAGQFYWGTKNAWLTNPHIHASGVGVIVPHWRIVDIDTPQDWQRAEQIFQTPPS